MLYTSVAVDVWKQVVTVLLPVSKTDPAALACERSWGCVCNPGGESAAACPFHAAVAQQNLLNMTFGEKVHEPGFPFAPAKDGTVVSKEVVVASVRRAAHAAGLDTKTADDEEAITGHFARIGGSRMMARCGVPVPSIMGLARWDSHVVLRYLKDALLVNITGEYRRA